MGASLATYGSDRRCVLAGGEAIRQPVYAATWTKIRIGLRGSFINAPGDIIGTPILAFGVCSGELGYGAPTPGHVVGVRTQLSSFVRTPGPPPVHLIWSSANQQLFKKVGATTTSLNSLTIAGGVGFGYYSSDTNVRSGLFIHLTKQSGTTIGCKIGSPNSVAAAQSDLTDSEFSQIMELGDLSSISSVKASYAASTSEITGAVNSGTDGPLDHIFAYWERSSQQFSFDILHRLVP